MTREEIKRMLEDTLIAIYESGYNKALEDVSDYMYSSDCPKLEDKQFVKLDSDIRKMKKYETNRE